MRQECRPPARRLESSRAFRSASNAIHGAIGHKSSVFRRRVHRRRSRSASRSVLRRHASLFNVRLGRRAVVTGDRRVLSDAFCGTLYASLFAIFSSGVVKSARAARVSFCKLSADTESLLRKAHQQDMAQMVMVSATTPAARLDTAAATCRSSRS